MIAIYVQKAWLDSLGQRAKFIYSRNETDTCVSLMGGEKIKISYPFVEAELVGAVGFDESKEARVFIPAYIPASVILGMFDLTEREAEAYGFQPPSAPKDVRPESSEGHTGRRIGFGAAFQD